MRTEQIGTAEATFLVFAMLSAKIFLTLPRYMMEDAQTAAWLLVLLSGAAGALGWSALVLFMRRFPGRSLIQAVEETLGPYLALPIQLLYMSFFVIVSALVLRQFAEAILTVVLPLTPISVIASTLMAAAAYASYLGVEAVARAARFFIPITVALVLLLLLLILPTSARLTETLPLLGPGIGPLLKWALIRSSLFIDVLLLPVLLPSLKEPEKMARIGYNAILWTILFWTLVVLVFQMSFPYPAGAANPFPLLAIARLINIGRFLQRVEAFFIFAWVFAAAAKISAALLGAVISYAETFHLRIYRPLVIPLALLILAMSFIPRDFYLAMTWDRAFLRVYGAIPVFILPLILWGVARVRRKGGKRDAQQKG